MKPTVLIGSSIPVGLDQLRLHKQLKQGDIVLNTDPDCDAIARLWVRGRTTKPFVVPANALRLAYCCGDVVLVPEDKCVDVKAWQNAGSKHEIELFSVRDQKVEVHSLGKEELSVTLNGTRCSCPAGEQRPVRLRRCVDPARREFYAPDFLDEPPVKYVPSGLPY